MDDVTLFEVLFNIQQELKVPKDNYNTFGKYKYRSCEDILESVKPVLLKYKAIIILNDSVEMIGSRFYVQAVAVLKVVGVEGSVSSSAMARESEEQKGMTGSQITGSVSSYARKYALNGLLLIDDTKDDDTKGDHTNKIENQPAPKIDPVTKEFATTFMSNLSNDAKAIIKLKAIPGQKLYEICNNFGWDKTKTENHFMSMLENDVPEVQEEI